MRYKVLIFCAMYFICSSTFARWATFKDANVEILENNTQIVINADGTYEKITEIKVKMVNESGRDAFSTLPIYYNNDKSTLEIIAAKTIDGDKEYNLDSSLIEDKPLASAINGFDQQHQVLLAFPNTKINAIIYLKYRMVMLKPDLSGFQESYFSFNSDYILKRKITIKSAVPLHVNLNDPDKYLSVTQKKIGNQYQFELNLIKPVFIKIIDEEGNLFDPNKYPWVFITTGNNWSKFGKKIATPFNKVLQQPLPELYKDIVAAALLENDPIKKINIVTSKLNESIQYMGDWKTSKGRHIPQDLVQVASKRLGDCKDFATGTVAMLNKLGMQATVALVQRGEGIYDNSNIKLPGFLHFNHAIVKVSLGEKVFWVDPTNFFSIADRILPDISDRQVLVLYASNTKLEHIPRSKVKDKKIVNERILNLKSSDIVEVKGSVLLEGLAAIKYTGAELRVSKQSIGNFLLYEQSSYDNIIDKTIYSPSLLSRIVADLNFKFEFTEKNTILRTNTGQAILITNPLASNYMFNDDQVSDVYMGAPSISRSVIKINNIVPVNTQNLDCNIKSPWVDAIRTVTYKNNHVIVEQEFSIKKSWISNEVLKSAEYKKTANDITKNFKEGIAIVFTKK